MRAMTYRSHRRPWSLWVLSLIILLIGIANLLLGLDHLRRAGYYRDLGVTYPPWLRAGLALTWGVILAGFGAGLARRRPWARRWLLIVTSNYGAFGVLWMGVYAESDYGRGRIAFQAVVTGLLVALLAWVLRWRRIRTAFESCGVPRRAVPPLSPAEPELGRVDGGEHVQLDLNPTGHHYRALENEPHGE
jgi:hypothetical protein